MSNKLELDRRSGPDRRSGKERRRGGPFGLPEQPTWKMFVVLFVAMFVLTVGASVFVKGLATQQDEMGADLDQLGDAVGQGAQILSTLQDGLGRLQSNVAVSRERGFASRAQNCMILIVDNDRNFDLTAACQAPEVTAYYPSQICASYFPAVTECGTKATDPAL